MKIGLIYAVSDNGVIGDRGTLAWHIPEDLKHFKEKTSGNTVIMGRKTWDSLPHSAGPLPDRMNIVMSKDLSFMLEQPYDNAYVAHSSEVALKMARMVEDLFPTCYVIGGAEIFTLFYPIADFLEVSHIRTKVSGDTYAGPVPDHFKAVSTRTIQSQRGMQVDFVRYER